MTEEEKKVLKILGQAWNSFIELPICHSSDRNEFNFSIHALQNIILSRAGTRAMYGGDTAGAALGENKSRIIE